MARIMDLNMSVQDVLIELAEGNPGAATACMELFQKAPEIDPDSALGGLGALLSLDTLELYGPQIYMLWSDVCGRDATKTIAIIRGHHLGFLTKKEIHHAVNNRGDGINVDDMVTKVKERLPNFKAA